jgi:predicted transglutaminase-like cysteine proteinase
VQSLPSAEIKNIKKSTTKQEEKAYPLFKKIFQFDRQLGIELGRLPEFQDGINEREILALENFVKFLSVSTDNDKTALRKILSIGKPEYRKFCSPLQALFWLAGKGELNNEKNPLENYSLEKLLDRAWTFEPFEYTKEEAISIIRNWKDKERAERLLNESKDDIERLNSKVNDFKKYLKADSFEDKNIFKKYKGVDKWNDFTVVVDRLNSPELIDYYERKNFCYDWERFSGAIRSARGSREYGYDMYYLFRTKCGVCTDFAAFTHYCLARSGYRAGIYTIPRVAGYGAQSHEVVVFWSNGKRYVLDNGTGLPRGIYELKESIVFIP